jgi:hypothetical protein
MAKVTGIICQILTSNIEDAGTDGTVYLGLGGREFHLDSKENDFQRGSAREYFLGAPPFGGPSDEGPIQQRPVLDEEKNDPRKGFPLDTGNLARTPVYIRFEPEDFRTNDHWNLHFAAALVYDTKFVIGYTPPGGFKNLWLGHKTGKILYLTEEHRDVGDAKLRALVRKLAAELKK